MRSMNTVPALVIKNLQKTYATGTEALKGVSLSVPAGDFFALLGPNGAGKTTIIGIATGLVNKTGGSVEVFGIDIDKHPEKAKAMIGVVPQELNFSIFEKPIDIVVNQAGYYGIPRTVALPRAEKLLQSLGIYDKRNLQSRVLSGGMKRRLMIARALVHEPKFLILDEPTAGVDVELRRSMWEFLQTLTKEGITILLTTHYLEEAEQLCKDVAIIHKGEIIASGTMKDMLRKLKTESVTIHLIKPISESAMVDLAPYHVQKIDDTTVEIQVGGERGLNDAILLLNRHGIPVESIRNRSGKLEEIFVNLTSV